MRLLELTQPIVDQLLLDAARLDVAPCVADTEWEAKVKGLLKGELKRHKVSYAQLVEKLAAIGVMDSEPNIRNKLSRGKFTAVFLVQCLEAIGASSLRLD